jgi:hypothetical protein
MHLYVHTYILYMLLLEDLYALEICSLEYCSNVFKRDANVRVM